MRWPVVFLFAAAVAASCGEPGVQFNVKRAPDFPAGRATVSVFGVYKDGRLNQESWDTLGPGLLVSLGGKACDAAYGTQMLTSAPALSAAVDDYARANGVTDDLLDQFAPMAKGDLILLLAIAGKPPQHGDAGAPVAQSAPMGRGRRGGGRMGSPSASAFDHNVFEVSASLFSVKLHHSVAELGMAYSGSSVEEALRAFATKLGAEMPGSTCAGWNWDARLDEEQIRKLSEEQ